MIKYLPFPITNLIWTLFFIVNSLLLVNVLNVQRNKSIALALLSISLLLLFYRHAHQTIYWAVGGVYIFYLLISTVWIYLYVKDKGFSLYICTIILGATTQNLVVSIITILLFDFIVMKFKTKKWNKKNILLLFLILPGLFVISLAPGSAARAGSYSTVDYSLINIVMSAFTLYIKGLSISLYMFPLIPIICIIIWKFTKEILIENTYLFSIKYLLAALASITVFAILPPEIAKAERVFIYYQFFLFIATIYFGLSLMSYFKRKYKVQLKISSLLFNSIVTGALSIFLIIIYKNLHYGFQLQKQVYKRELLITSASTDTDVFIPIIKKKHGVFYFIHNFHDLSGRTDFFSNEAAAKYYKINSIRTDKH